MTGHNAERLDPIITRLHPIRDRVSIRETMTASMDDAGMFFEQNYQ